MPLPLPALPATGDTPGQVSSGPLGGRGDHSALCRPPGCRPRGTEQGPDPQTGAPHRAHAVPAQPKHPATTSSQPAKEMLLSPPVTELGAEAGSPLRAANEETSERGYRPATRPGVRCSVNRVGQHPLSRWREPHHPPPGSPASGRGPRMKGGRPGETQPRAGSEGASAAPCSRPRSSQRPSGAPARCPSTTCSPSARPVSFGLVKRGALTRAATWTDLGPGGRDAEDRSRTQKNRTVWSHGTGFLRDK